jgi:hypothetical protein
MRFVSAVTISLVALAAAATAPGAAPPTPACPQVEGWTYTGTFGPLDNGNAVEFECQYAYPGQPNQLALDMHWYKPTARDVDVDWNQCGRATSGGAYYTDIWSKSHFVHEEYVVNAGSAESNRAIFKAEQERIQKAALAIMTATESLAKSCAKTAPAPAPVRPAAPAKRDTTRPKVRVQPAGGRAGTQIPLNFTVADDSGRAGILITIYRGANDKTVLMKKSYGTAKAEPPGHDYTAKVLARSRGTSLWCLTATDAAGNAATACSKLVVR